MKLVTRVFSMLVAVTWITACQDVGVQDLKPIDKNLAQKDVNQLRLDFAQSLAKAMSNEEIRDFIKAESLINFDGDSDVLFAMAFKKKMKSGKTFGEVFSKYATDSQIRQTLNDLPLITVFVPSLKSFSPKSWDTKTQIPVVAVINDSYDEKKDEDIIAFFPDKQIKVSTKIQPSFPVIVVKDIERLVSHKSNDQAPNARKVSTENGKAIFATNEHQYYFPLGVDPNADKKARSSLFFQQFGSFLQYPYQNNLDTHRDHMYYGIDASTGVNSGLFRRNVTEYITSMRFLNTTAVNGVTSNWTEGNLEFRLNHIYMDRNGTPHNDPKVFYCPQSAIYEPTTGRFLEVNMNIELKPWDMYNYGNEWKINVQEFDDSGTDTKTVTNASTFGFNFEISAEAGIDKILKIGTKFGLSGSTTTTTTSTITTSISSDDLGLATFYFSDPVVYYVGSAGESYNGQRMNSTYFLTYERQTGSVSLAVEPRQTY